MPAELHLHPFLPQDLVPLLQLFPLRYSVVVGSSRLNSDFYYYWLLPSLILRVLPEYNTPVPVYPPLGMTVLLHYSRYSVPSMRALCVQLTATIGFYLSHPRLCRYF